MPDNTSLYPEGGASASTRKFVVFNPGSHPAPRWIARALAVDGSLVRYWTSGQMLTSEAKNGFYRLLPGFVRRELQGRLLPEELDSNNVGRAGIALDIAAAIAKRLRRPNLERRLLHARNRVLARKAVRSAAAVRGGSVWLLLPTNTHSDIATLCDQKGIPYALYTPLPYAPYCDALMDDEALENPAWSRHLHFVSDDPLAGDRNAATEAAGARLVIANSKFTADSFATIVPRDRVVAVPLAVNVDQFRRAALLGRARGSLRETDEPLSIVYTGHISQRKGLFYLFSAVAEASNHGNFTITLFGSDTTGMQDQLRKTFPDVSATFVPSLPQRDLWERMSEHHVFAFPTLLDGFGNALIEAAALGLPIVATPRCGAVDLGLSPEAAIIVNAGSATDLTKALVDLYAGETSRRLMSTRSAEIVAAGRTWSDYGSDVVEIMKAAR